MRLSKIDLNLFVVFDSIYRERNLTRAARALHITQPAVSHSLSRLRTAFDDQLFVRQSGHMVPTPVAESIVDRVRSALTNLQSSVSEHNDFIPETSTRKFLFAMNDYAESSLLPPLMACLQQRAAHISIESYAVPRHELSREFAAGQLDFALDAPLVNDPQLTHQALTEDPYVCVARRDHPQLTGPTISLEQYLELPHIHVSSRRKGQGHIDLHLNRMGLQRKILLRAQNWRTAPPIAANTDMLLTVAKKIAQEHDLQIFQLPFALPCLDTHLYWSTHYTHDKAHQWMREIIFNIFRQGEGL